MPSMASITIKKADSVTDATYAMLAASPGDGVGPTGVWTSAVPRDFLFR